MSRQNTARSSDAVPGRKYLLCPCRVTDGAAPRLEEGSSSQILLEVEFSDFTSQDCPAPAGRQRRQRGDVKHGPRPAPQSSTAEQDKLGCRCRYNVKPSEAVCTFMGRLPRTGGFGAQEGPPIAL